MLRGFLTVRASRLTSGAQRAGARRPGLITLATPAAVLLTVGDAIRNAAPEISWLLTTVITRPAMFQEDVASCDSDCDTEHPYLVR